MKNNAVTYNNLFTVPERKEMIADMLKIYRQINKFTQLEIAEKLGINAQTYATYERGRNEPPAEILVRLSYLYNVPVDLLIQRDNLYKDKNSAKKTVKEFDDVIDAIRSKILSGDPKTREAIKDLTDVISNAMKIIEENIKDNESK